MIRKILLCFAFFAFFLFSNALAQTIRYVKENGSGNKSGTSWADASNDLQVMINASAAGDQVWVANGNYRPTHRADNMSDADPNDHDNAFVMKKDVKVFGCFDGTETSISQRYIPPPTPFADNGGTVLTGNKNYYHLVISAGESGTAELNGFYLNQGLSGTTSTPGGINLPGVDAPIDRLKGGGIYIYSSDITLSNITIYNCIARNYGGAMFISNSSPAITNVAIFSCVSNNGGGIYNDYSSPVLTNVSIRGCSAHIGAAICNNHSSPVITNCVISGCDGSFTGTGGIDNTNSSPVLTNVTITGNRGNGISNSISSTSKIRNCILYHNDPSLVNDATSSAQIEHSYIEYEAGGSNGNLPGSIDPLMYDLLSGATGAFIAGDWELQLQSPLLDKGNNSYYNAGQVPDLSGITTDLGRHSRIQNGTIDIGAYEGYHVVSRYLHFVTYVTPTGSGNFSGSSWDNATSDLQMAINAFGTQQVWVAAGTYKPIYRADDENTITSAIDDQDNAFVLKREVKVYGGFAGTEEKLIQRDSTLVNNQTILSGEIGRDNMTSDNAHHVVISAGRIGAAELNSFFIKDAYGFADGNVTVNSESVDGNYGGGISNISSSPILANLEISGNRARSGGGGIYNFNADPTITKVTISENTSGFGGGIDNKSSSPVLNEVTLTKNSGTSGGGIYNSSSSPALNNTTINQNTALKGGGIYNSSSSPVINSSSVYLNTAQYGGGIYNTNSSPVSTGVDIIFNNADQQGGGVYNANSNPEFKDLTIGSNKSVSNGGAMYNSASSPGLVNVALVSNTSSSSGGGIYNYDGSSPSVNNVVFVDNTANLGGGIANENSSPHIINVTFSGNKALSGNGGGVYNLAASTATISNSVFWNNTAVSQGEDIYDDGSTSSVTYSYTQSTIAGVGNIKGTKDPFMSSGSPVGADIYWRTADDGLQLNGLNGYFGAGLSPVNGGSNGLIPSGITTDITGALRIQKGKVDMGAYESSYGTLPVTLISFNGTLHNQQARLQWQTGEENNFNHFEINNSEDSRVFTSVGEVVATGSNSTYNYFVPQTESVAYYRLKIVDNDGNFAYSDIKLLSQSAALALIYPNPAKDEIHVKVTNAGLLRIYNAAGKLEKTQSLQAGINIINISTLSAGMKFCVIGEEKVGFMKE